MGKNTINSDAGDGSAPLRLGPRFAGALLYALDVHGAQYRKDTAIPYISHLMAVSSLVLEYDGDEDEAVAALLHDAAEDSDDGDEQLRRIGQEFGPRVRAIVHLCSDTVEQPKPPWLERKQRYIRHLNDDFGADRVDSGYLRVALADKLHNARSIVADMRRDGDDSVFDRFNSGKDHEEKKRNTLAYYADLARAYARYDGTDLGIRALSKELTGAVRDLGADEEATLG